MTCFVCLCYYIILYYINLSALIPKSYVLQYVPCPDKESSGVDCLMKKSLQSIKQHTKISIFSNAWKLNYQMREKKVILNVIYRLPHGSFLLSMQKN